MDYIFAVSRDLDWV